MIIKKRILGLMFATACSLGATAAMAADYEPPVFEAPSEDEYVPVEVGSGWYLRGDVAYNLSRDYKDTKRFADDFILDDSYISDLGWIGPVDLFSTKEKQTAVSASLGMGYHFNDFLRAEVNIGTHGSAKYDATGTIWGGVANANGSLTIFPEWSAPTARPDFGCLGDRTTTTTTTTVTPQPDLVTRTPQPPLITVNPITGVTTVTPMPDIVTTTAQAPVTNVSTNSNTDANWRRDCALSASASNRMYDGTANLFVDLGTFAGVTPYLGAGLGMVYSRNKALASARCANGSVSETVSSGGPLPANGTTSTTTTRTFNCADTTDHKFFEYDKANYNLVYSLSGGLSYQMSQNVALDVGYTFKSVPGMEYYAVSATDIEKRKGYDMHQVKVGLRYDLW